MVTTPFHAKFNELMKVSLVQEMVTFLNILLSKNGISSELSPASIILGSPNTDYYKFRITIGSYAKFYIGNTNSTKKRTVGAIALRPKN